MAVNLLQYLRSNSQVDFDSQDVELSQSLGPFVDCTSNQIDGYYEATLPRRAELVKQSAILAEEFTLEFPGVTYEEVAVEVALTSIALTLAPHITGSIFVMANPVFAYSTEKVYENAKRIYAITRKLQPSFDLARLCIKVPATWEGLQACRQLKDINIKTLATTVFTLEQTILAAEAGCIYVSPFGHELRALLDEKYTDDGPYLNVPLEAQKYYQTYSYSTRVKAAGLNSVEEVLRLSGVEAITIPADVLKTLATTEADEESLKKKSIFNTTEYQTLHLEKVSFIDDEDKYRKAFGERDNGKGQERTTQAIEIFSEYELKAEEVMKNVRSGQ
ncbi:hypothetical protein F5B22DRAFT_603353 [Xylaria bambusicola]|uniref:uncharacterized protein n=1 Tax=Xylaria bambusicola TaxID=326684 RepID=UPI002007E419|nr:uncharacterized protein F5B22DRAFT_603353 [Xylaria bambusicola]KAI0517550.1 hypothetical protein F5B22DRAFT_603353 [Xylaria bambusicola]